MRFFTIIVLFTLGYLVLQPTMELVTECDEITCSSEEDSTCPDDCGDGCNPLMSCSSCVGFIPVINYMSIVEPELEYSYSNWKSMQGFTVAYSIFHPPRIA